MSSRGDRWTSEQIEQLKKLYADGLSCSKIAPQIIGGNFTRNAVIGKVHRLKLALRGQTKAAPKEKKPKIQKRVSRIVWANGNSDKLRMIDFPTIEAVALRCAEIVPQHVSLIEMVGCKYPYGEGPFTFCNHPRVEGESYCGPHYALVRNRPRTNSEAVTAARSRRMRGLNFRRSLLEASP